MSKAHNPLLLIVINHRGPGIRHRKAGVSLRFLRLRRRHGSTDTALVTELFDVGLQAFKVEIVTARAIGPRKGLLMPLRRQIVVAELACLTKSVGAIVE